MFSFLKKAAPTKERDLEQLIYDIAERQLDQDYQELFHRMKSRLVCMPVKADSIPAAVIPGQKYQVTSQDALLCTFITLQNGMSFAAATTSEDSPLLKNSFAYIDWIEFLKMSLKMEQSISGVFLQGKLSWVAFDRVKIMQILGL